MLSARSTAKPVSRDTGAHFRVHSFAFVLIEAKLRVKLPLRYFGSLLCRSGAERHSRPAVETFKVDYSRGFHGPLPNTPGRKHKRGILTYLRADSLVWAMTCRPVLLKMAECKSWEFSSPGFTDGPKTQHRVAFRAAFTSVGNVSTGKWTPTPRHRKVFLF